MKRFLWLGIAILVFFISGCAHLEDYLEIAREKGVSTDYKKILGKWSRDKVVHSQFETRVRISATLQSEEFTKAYLREYSRIYQLNEEEVRHKEGVYYKQAKDVTEFIVYAYLPEKAANDFDKPGSIWKIALLSRSGRRSVPVKIERIEPVTPLITEFFPYIKPYYGNAYRLQFAAVENDGDFPLRLVFTSVIGTVELTFEN